MADETVVNGVASDHVVVDDDDRKSEEEEAEIVSKRDRDLDLRKDSEISELKKKIEGLEKEKSGFVKENQVKNEKIKVLSDEIEGLKKKEGEMKKEIAKSEDDKKALQAISSRAADLETEVSRMQHDLISTMSENEDARAELQKIKSEIEVYKRSIREKETSVEKLEKEKVSLQEKINQLVEEMKVLKAANGVLNRDVVGCDSKLAEKDNEYLGLLTMKKKVETEKSSVEEELKISEEKFKEMESKVKILEIELDLSEKVINELKDKNSKLIDDAEKEKNGCSKLQWPAAALASTGTVAAAAAAVCYFTYAKRR